MKRMEYVPGNYYNFHPGSHVGQGVEKGIELICELLNKIIRPEQSTIILLETMSGKGAKWEAGLKSCVPSSTAWSRRIRSASAWIRVM